MFQCLPPFRDCYEEGELINGTIHAFVKFGDVKLKTTLESEELLSLVYTLSSTMVSIKVNSLSSNSCIEPISIYML